MRGLVFDQPTVAPNATQAIREQGLEKRIQAIGGSFSEKFPPELAECDVFHMKFILHDWSDQHCVQILKNIAAVAKPGAKVVSVDTILGIDGHGLEQVKALMDIQMMATLDEGAKERTKDEYFNLFKLANIPATPQLRKLRTIVSLVEVAL